MLVGLRRYCIVRGRRPADCPLPDGIRQDTRKHTRHVLRPTAELVSDFLACTDERGFQRFRKGYLALLHTRRAQDPTEFDALAALARKSNVYLGCNCPTARQPSVERCHTSLALVFMREHYPGL